MVRVEGGEVVAVTRLILERIRWETLSTDLTGCGTEAESFEAVRACIRSAVDALGETPLIFRMTLCGMTSLHRQLLADADSVVDEVLAAAAQVGEQAWLESVTIATSEPVDLHAAG